MHEPDFWTFTAEAMELSIEGNRLIAAEIAEGFQTLWRALRCWSVRWLGCAMGGRLTPDRRLPPI